MVVQSLDSIVRCAKSNVWTYSAGLIVTVKKKSCVQMSSKLSIDIRINKRGEKTIVYLVSNYNAHSKEHVQAYKLR